MAEVLRHLRQFDAAVDKPSFHLLRTHHPEVTAAVLLSAFPDTDVGVDAETLHARVDGLLAELSLAGAPVRRRDGQRIGGREMCRDLLTEQILGLSPNSNEYSLAPGAVEAIEVLERLASQSVVANSSRIERILQAARELAAMTTVNPTQRIEQIDRDVDRLQSELAALITERERIAAGGEVPGTAEGVLIDALDDFLDLVKRLPADMARVRDKVDAERRRVMNELRADDRSTGAAIMEHLANVDDVLGNTREGQAFQGLRDLLGDSTKLRSLRSDLLVALNHPVFVELLNPADRRDVQATGRRLRDGLTTVQHKRDRTMEALSAVILSRSLIEERELARTLNDINKELATWLATATTRTHVEWDLIPEALDMDYLHERFDESFVEDDPQPLADTSGEIPRPPSLAEARAWGGPQPEVAHQILELIVTADGAQVTLGELFNMLDAPYRRPVELFGLSQLAADAGVILGAAPTDPFHTVRPDNTECTIYSERVVLTTEQATGLLERFDVDS